MASAVEEAAWSHAAGRGLSFELDRELTAEDIECLILTGMHVRRCAGSRWNQSFPQREDPPLSGGPLPYRHG